MDQAAHGVVGEHEPVDLGTTKFCKVNRNGDFETMPAAEVLARSALTGITARQPRDHTVFGGPPQIE